ncbi:MAG: major capsid protein [Microviridae sp.]|nr:MAG: major capsid protein [Microviridae sp.]
MPRPNKRMPTVMKSGHQFSQVPSVSINRSVFDRSHGHKTTFDAGLLIPFFLDWILPGDTMTLRLHAMVRMLNPLFKPVMDNLYLETFFFFVPDRLVWTNFPKFMGEQVNPGDSIAYTTPQITLAATLYSVHSIQDYFGLNSAQHANGTWTHSALPIRAYNLIYNQWFRDENLINSVTVDMDDGSDGAINITPYKRGKRHDYFTSCLPFLQKGTAVSMPLGTQAPVRRTDAADPGIVSVMDAGGGYDTMQVTAVNTDLRAGTFFGAGAAGNRLYADLTGATAATINDFRQAVAVQQFLERDARGGTRLTEIIYNHFHVRSDDARLQRAEYLGGGSTPILINPVAQQSQTGLTGGTTQLGNLVGVASAGVGGHGFTRSFTEHGMIIGIVNVRSDLTYSQGVERHWFYSTRYDRFWPVLEELGEQSVLMREIYLVGAAADTTVFGYQERYAEDRYKKSMVTGLMAPTAATDLAVYNLSEEFTAPVTLGQTFIEDQTETVLDRCVTVNTEPDFVIDAFFDYKCARPMRVFGVPGLHRL